MQIRLHLRRLKSALRQLPFPMSTLLLHPELYQDLLGHYLRETVGSIKPLIKGEIKKTIGLF